jgi:flagellin-like protein
VRGRKNSGISPVVATVILVAVAIVIAIAVAFWASGLVGIFTRFEKLEILSAYQDTDVNVNNIVIRVRNTGSSPTSITEVVINGVAVRSVAACDLGVGETKVVTITTRGLMAGVTYEVLLKTAGGKQYPTAVLAHSGGTPGIPTINDVNCGGGGEGGGPREVQGGG